MSDIPVLDTRAPTGLTPGSNAAEKLTKRLRRQAGQAIVDYGMIRDGERIMVCLSGGKDSYTLLDTLLHLQQVAPVSFTLRAVNLDQKQPGFPEHVLPNYLAGLGVDYEIIERDTYSVVTEKIAPGATMCGLCSRLRRGILYRYARENGFTRIALGHHRDDIVETMFLNMFHGARLAAMPPKLKSDDGGNVVIRPLAYCAEAEIEKYSRLKQFPIIPCNLCGSQENLARQNVKAMLADWERIDPGRCERIFRSMTRIAPSQMADGALFDFAGLEADAHIP
ncbi:MAG: tRNA 2-thiocytidine(32) synthetase TtcA [Salinisphaera sp.]|uniref:tRNA 2-thiocytidine(32) synthetase TtcA n=1 Tax=Salinisphaera sp. TaxID=1914330 RepID=UPI003C799568